MNNATETIGYIISCTTKRDPTIYNNHVHNVLNRVAGYFSKHPSYLFVRDRKTERVYARQLCIYLLRTERVTEQEIADLFNLKRAVVNYHTKKLADLLTVDPMVKRDVFNLLNYVQSSKLAYG